MAEAAAERDDYESFHDLAWRAVQTGPPRDPALMYLLARAQAKSGRPHDALVMLDRLAEMGVASDAETEDFVRTRQLPGWPDVAARIERLRAPPGLPAPPASVAAPPAAAKPPVAAPPAAVRPPVAGPVAAKPAAKPAPPPAAPTLSAPEPVPTTTTLPSVVSAVKLEAARFSTTPFTIGGVTYDAVSRRVLFGDRLGRKLVSVSEGSNHSEDLVRGDSAGFYDISAVDIDDRRGDLWVASAADADGGGTLHRLQLVSGRPLRSFRIAPADKPVDLVDLAVTRGGTILLLDAANGRILALAPRAADVKTVARIDLPDPMSMAVGVDEASAYVAYRDGLARIDLTTRRATRVRTPKDVSLAGLQQIRWHRNALIAITPAEGASRILQVDLTASGRAVRRVTTLESAAAIVGRPSVSISGDDLLYVSPGAGDAAAAVTGRSTGSTGFAIYRVHLR